MAMLATTGLATTRDHSSAVKLDLLAILIVSKVGGGRFSKPNRLLFGLVPREGDGRSNEKWV